MWALTSAPNSHNYVMYNISFIAAMEQFTAVTETYAV